MQDVPEGKDYSFPAEELKTLAFWDEIDAFKTQLKLTEGKPEYVFYDGPPFATGLPHYGHILAGTIKDVVTRFASATGHHVSRRFGWDCHGLPVEYEIDKALGIKGKEDVLAMGIDKYNESCRAIVMRYSKEWEATVKRVGRWIDFDNDYKTLDPSFMESVWWVFKTLHDKGLVYRGFKVMPYSTACNTPLSNFEAGLDYRDVADPAVMVSFPIENDDDGASLVAWTTTPWTLPANVALCVHPEIEYVRARAPHGGVVIVAAARLASMPGATPPKAPKTKPQPAAPAAAAQPAAAAAAADAKPTAAGAAAKQQQPKPPKQNGAPPDAAPACGYTVLSRFPGSALAGLHYTPLFPFASARGVGPKAFTVLCDAYVTSDSGTGVVHQAPAFGEDDFRVCTAAGVLRTGEQPFDPTDANGRFLASAAPPFGGKHVKEADKEIVAAVKALGRLVDAAQLQHSYPFCWRSHTPLIYKAVPSFFVAVEKIKDRLLVANDATRWVPAYVSEKRFRNWLEGAHDWAVSRNRFWGTPIPVWRSDDGLEEVVVGSVEQLFELSGVRVTDLHRHFVDSITIPSSRGAAFGVLKRCEDVFDCWFESGSMPYAQAHYPFENKAAFEASFPADFVAEGLDQTRGWFYTLMVLSTALFDKPAFKNLVCNGLVLAEDGKKMSKSLRNYPPPDEIVAELGADALRLYLVNSPVVRAEPLRFSKAGVFAVVKDLFLKWYNAYRFLVQNVRRSEAEAGEGAAPWRPGGEALSSATNVLDVWIVSSSHVLAAFVAAEMGAYRLYTVAPALVRFIEQLCNVYVRLNRGRLKGKGGRADAGHALAALYDVLLRLCALMTPFTPFFTETMFQNLRRAAEPHAPLPASVHFCDFPTAAPPSAETERVCASVGRMSTVLDLARAIRERHGRSVKTPVRRVTVVHPDEAFLADIRGQLGGYVREEVNALELLASSDVSAFCTLRCEPNWALLGKRLGKGMAGVGAAVKAMAAADVAAFESTGSISLAGTVLTKDELTVIRTFKLPPGVDAADMDAAGDGDVLVVIDLRSDDSLVEAGLAREAAARVNKARKAGGFSPGDALSVHLWAPRGPVLAALLAQAVPLGATLGCELSVGEAGGEGGGEGFAAARAEAAAAAGAGAGAGGGACHAEMGDAMPGGVALYIALRRLAAS